MKPYLQTTAHSRYVIKIILLALVGYGITRLYEVTDLVSQEVCLWTAAIYMMVVMPNRWYTGLVWTGMLWLFYWGQW